MPVASIASMDFEFPRTDRAEDGDVGEDLCDIPAVLGKLVEPVSPRVEALCEPPPDLCELVQARRLLRR
jgi:hypothetical protein